MKISKKLNLIYLNIYFELEQAENNYDLETAARIKNGILPELEINLMNFLKR